MYRDPVAAPRTVTPARVAFVAAWAAALYAVAQVRHVFGGHSYCGLWGCGPSSGALLGAHGVWFVLLTPAAVLAGSRLPRPWALLAGVGMAFAGVVGTAAYVAWDAWQWHAGAASNARPFVWNRAVFTLMNQVEVPLLPGAAAGAALWLSARLRGRGDAAADSAG